MIYTPHDIASRVYGCVNVTYLVDGCLLCPLLWGGLWRLEPGSLCGSQSAESSHLHRLTPLCQDARGRPLRNAEPPQLFHGLNRAVRAMGQQYEKIVSLPNLPTSHDPNLIAGTHLQKDGRSTALSLFRAQQAQPQLVRRVKVRGSGQIVALPRTLFTYVKATEEQPATWVRADLQKVVLSQEVAELVGGAGILRA